MYTGRAKLIRIIGGPDKKLPDKRSSTVIILYTSYSVSINGYKIWLFLYV